jgi:hypothetical protein
MARPPCTGIAHRSSTRTRGVLSASLLATALLSGGCVGPSPELSLAGAYAPNGASGADGAQLVHLVIDARNSSDRPIPLTIVDYAVQSDNDGGAGMTITRETKVAIGPGSVERFELPAIVPAGSSEVSLRAVATFLPQNKLRELLSDLLPLPTVRLSGSTSVRATPGDLPVRLSTLPGGLVLHARRLAAPTTPVADTLPPLAQPRPQ